MPKALDLWDLRYQSLRRTFQVSEKSIRLHTGYIYRVANIFYEAAFALMVTQPQGAWQELFFKAIEYFRQSAGSDDCSSRPEYPLNLARLLHEWYLAQWVLGAIPEGKLVDRSIELYNEGLWSNNQTTMDSFAPLPMLYLLRKDRTQVMEFWKILGKRSKLDRLPAEIDLWHRWSDQFANPDPAAPPMSGFLIAYGNFCRQQKDPTTWPARFYLSAARISSECFNIQGTTQALLTRMAITPWGVG